jgi:hypothetical protein
MSVFNRKDENGDTTSEMYVIVLTCIYKSLSFDAGGKIDPEVFDMFAQSLLSSFDAKHKADFMKAYKHVKEMGLNNLNVSIRSTKRNKNDIQKMVESEKQIFTQLNDIFNKTGNQ